MCWSIASLLESDDRLKFDQWLREKDTNKLMPKVNEGETIFEYFVKAETCEWEKWSPPTWEYPVGEKLDFSNLLVPTMDSTRALYVINYVYKQKHHFSLSEPRARRKQVSSLCS